MCLVNCLLANGNSSTVPSHGSNIGLADVATPQDVMCEVEFKRKLRIWPVKEIPFQQS